MLEFVVYRSRFNGQLTELALLDILKESIRGNARNGLTGFMHCYEGWIFHYLEGPVDPLRHKVSVIAADKRHRDFLILAEGDLDERLFADFDLGFMDLPSAPARGVLPRDQFEQAMQLVSPEDVVMAFAKHAGAVGYVSVLEKFDSGRAI